MGIFNRTNETGGVTLSKSASMVIFDLDGTLWDAGQSLAESWGVKICDLAGVDKRFTAEDIHGVMGLTMDEIADNLLPEVETPRRYEIFDACMDYELEYLRDHGGVLYPQVKETLLELLKSGRKLTIVSNCQEDYVKTFLDSMDMWEYFCDYEEWGRTGMLKADNIRYVMERNGIEHAIYVGDIQKDADAAAEAGIPCIWAAYGFGQIRNPAGVIREFAELPAVLDEIGY